MTPTREEFLHFSVPEKALFYLLAAATLGYLGWQIWERVQIWKQGRPVAPNREGWRYWLPTKEAAKAWWANIAIYVLAQKKVRSSRQKSGAPMHLLIFYGFLALTVATTLLGINTYSPIKFHKGDYYLLYEVTFDTLGLLLFAGLVWAIVRRLALSREGSALIDRMRGRVAEEPDMARQLEDNRRFPLSHSKWDLFVLVLLLLITANGYLLEAGRISNNPKPWDGWSWVGHALAQGMGNISEGAYKGLWWFHIVLVLGFFAVIPRLRIRHVLLAIASTAGKPDVVMGKLRTIPMEEVEQTEKIGAKEPADLSRWNLMSLDACMECGRCTEVCPAWRAGKLLNPKQIVQDARGAMATKAELATSLSEEALWQCTTCNACVEACPVLIRHVDIIVDVRRNLVSEGALSGSVATMLRQTASTGHAWGAPAHEREKWMEGLDIPLCRDGAEFDVLFWVGCAGATDPGAVRTTKAVAGLLKKAGIRFACLGREEACTGDPARRTGEEFLFQEKAMENASVFESYGVKTVVTACPHCFNTLKNEYGDFGAQMEVFHHTQLLGDLVSKGVLLAAKPEKTVLHDPCYLTRVNGEVDAPRKMAEGLVQPPNRGRKTLCCGAGGGRMWMEEPADQRPSDRRVEELLATGAETVAVACPFCRIMLDGPLKAKDEGIRLLDLAEMMAEKNGV
ncbi:heterodisulfide reductase-related iron-sulfur binding cluster [soil metagenome]